MASPPPPPQAPNPPQPQAPLAPNPVPPPPKKKSKNTVLIAVLVLAILLVISAIAAYAAGLFSLDSLKKDVPAQEVLNRMFENVSRIETAASSTVITFQSQPRSSTAKSWAEAFPDSANMREAIERDQKRLDDLDTLQSAITAFYSQNKRDPISLEELTSSGVGTLGHTRDPKTNELYGYRQEAGGQDYVLHIELETKEALDAYKQAIERTNELAEEQFSPVFRNESVVEITKNTPAVYVGRIEQNSALPITFGLDDVYEYLPVEVDGKFSFKGQSVSDGDSITDSLYELGGYLKLGGTTFEGETELRKKNDEYYFNIKQGPSLGLIDLAAIKNKWMQVTEKDLSNYLGDVSAENANILPQYQLLLKILYEEGAVQIVQEFEKEETEDGELYHYEITLDEKKIAKLYKRLTEESEAAFGDDAIIEFNPEIQDRLESSDFSEYYKALQENIKLEIWIDDVNFWPQRVAYTAILVPPDSVTKSKDIQYELGVSVGVENINQPFSVTPPAEFMPLNDALELIFGGSYGGIKSSVVKSSVGQLRTLAEVYYDTNNAASYIGFDECVKGPSVESCKDPSIVDSVSSIKDELVEKEITVNFTAASSAEKFCLAHPLETEGNVCVDSTGEFAEGERVVCDTVTIACSE